MPSIDYQIARRAFLSDCMYFRTEGWNGRVKAAQMTLARLRAQRATY